LSLSVGNAAAEFLYSVVPRNRHLNQKYPQGTLGTDSGFVPENLAILKRANFNWLITKFLGRWYVVEPERDRYQFNDAAIAATDSNHLSVVIQFLNPSWGIQKWLKPFSKPRGGAVWATEKKQTFMNEWQQMVSETVSHYRASVGDWEIWNEPNAAFGAAEYGEILKLAAQSIRKADPRARIVGFSGGGFNTKFYDEVLRRAGADSFDVASVHFYGNQLETHRAYDSFLKRTGKPGWNTETGASCPTSFTTLPDFESLRVKDHWAHLQNEVRRVTENSVKNYLISLSVGGMERYFHYFARMGNCSPSQPTRWFGSGKEINEFDGSLRANGVGLCIASHFIDGSKYHGPVVLDDRLQVHLFKRTEGCVGYLYSVSDKLEIPQSKNMNLQFHDIMGNRLPGDRISIGSSPVYFTTELDAAESIRTLNSLSGDE
jgi:hypothetical protein